MTHLAPANYHFTQCESITQVDADRWNAIAGTDYPFMRHEFLAALEQSGSVGGDSGWQPNHIIARADPSSAPTNLASSKTLLAIAPSYLKDHSYGEYVFDWAWADAYHRHQLEYYPKLVTAIPFTPASGPRFVVAAEVKAADAATLRSAFVEYMVEQVDKHPWSSWHLLFPQTDEYRQYTQLELSQPLSQRRGCQFHWFNRGYEDFDDFLQSFASRKRKKLKRERRRVSDQGISLRRLNGDDISVGDIDGFYRFYQATYLKRGQHGYLTPDFFHRLRDTMAEQLLLVVASRHGEDIGAAFCLVGADTLYGRYWGCIEEYECLHFEACFYQGIEYCIEHKLGRFDPGAQGEHKILRGFEPTTTWSLHWIKHPQFRLAIDDFLRREQAGMDSYEKEASELLPFKQED